jgi:hypothetical protein
MEEDSKLQKIETDLNLCCILVIQSAQNVSYAETIVRQRSDKMFVTHEANMANLLKPLKYLQRHVANQLSLPLLNARSVKIFLVISLNLDADKNSPLVNMANRDRLNSKQK